MKLLQNFFIATLFKCNFQTHRYRYVLGNSGV